jgi:hypothetical protein
MQQETDIYSDFKGYNAYPLKEAEKIIRSRFGERIEVLLEKIKDCVEKAKRERRLKTLSEVEKARKRIDRMKNLIEERDMIFIAAYLKERITAVDEEKLKTIDYRVAELIGMSETIISEIACGETDLHIIDKFTKISEYFREMENCCHERALLFRKDVRKD